MKEVAVERRSELPMLGQTVSRLGQKKEKGMMSRDTSMPVVMASPCESFLTRCSWPIVMCLGLSPRTSYWME
jgi:hypothetical protein